MSAHKNGNSSKAKCVKGKDRGEPTIDAQGFFVGTRHLKFVKRTSYSLAAMKGQPVFMQICKKPRKLPKKMAPFTLKEKL